MTTNKLTWMMMVVTICAVTNLSAQSADTARLQNIITGVEAGFFTQSFFVEKRIAHTD